MQAQPGRAQAALVHPMSHIWPVGSGGQGIPHLLPTLLISAPAAAQEEEVAQPGETRKKRRISDGGKGGDAEKAQSRNTK